MKDQDIIDLYWKRNEYAIVVSTEQYGNFCHTIAYNILHNIEDAQECVNDTWLKAWESIPPHRPERLPAFFGKITRNLSLDRLKKYTAKKRGLGQTELALSELEDCIADETSMNQILDEKVLVEALNAFLYDQPQQRRNIFIRRYWYLSSIKDIAASYAMSESKIASMLYRMRNELKKHLEKEGIHL